MFNTDDAAHLYSGKGSARCPKSPFNKRKTIAFYQSFRVFGYFFKLMPFSFFFRFYYFSKYLLSHLYEYLIITEGFGIVWSIGVFSYSFFLCELSFWGSSDKIATHDNLLRHIFMHSTFSYFLSIPGQKTRHKVSELDVFVQIYERWYYWKMKRVFTHNAEKSIFPISLNSHGEYSVLPVASCPIPLEAYN